MCNFNSQTMPFLPAVVALGMVLSGCTSLSGELSNQIAAQEVYSQENLITEVIQYPASLSPKDRVQFAELKQITPEMARAVTELFPDRDAVLDINAATQIADWMVDPNGLGMTYDIDANFTPIEAFRERRANCISFTLLLRELAKQTDINIDVNEVDIPANWGMNFEENVVFYRHVNGIRLRGPRRQVFDLALDQFRFEYPQRRISEAHAYAQLVSNKAVDALRTSKYAEAEHLIKSALANHQDDPNLWVNFGVINERLGNTDKAAAIYRLALGLDDSTLVAVSNLARVYEKMGLLNESKLLQKRAEKIRSRNPYQQFFLAKDHLANGNARAARRHINKALSMHNKDSRFYELRSRSWQLSERYSKALKDMQKAYELSYKAEERFHYKSKAVYIAHQINRQNKERTAKQLQTMINLRSDF